MKNIFIMMLFAVCAGGCGGLNDAKVAEARQMILDHQAECVLIKNGRIIARECGGGVSPLLNVYDAHKDAMSGGIIVDKVVGRAAAAVAVCGKVRHVHGMVMSEDAVIFLNENGVEASYTLLVPRILNKKRNCLCPLEQAVAGINEPEKALAAVRRKIESLRKQK